MSSIGWRVLGVESADLLKRPRPDASGEKSGIGKSTRDE
jgi:hypothetical protein